MRAVVLGRPSVEEEGEKQGFFLGGGRGWGGVGGLGGGGACGNPETLCGLFTRGHKNRMDTEG